MARHKSKIFSERELAIMNAVWDLRKATIHQIRERMGGTKAGAYTSIATMVKFLENKGALKHSIAGRTYHFESRISRERAGITALRHVLRGFFGNDRLALLRALVSKERFTEAEKQEALAIISEAKSRTN